MRTAIFAAALLVGTAAIAQDYGTTTPTEPETTIPAETTPDAQAGMTDTTTTMEPTTQTTQWAATTSLPAVVQPDNSNPEHDARGIAVISDPAVVPAGFNGVSGTGMGGPLIDPVSGETVVAADDAYPNCTAEVTDNCLQAYERGRSSE